VVDVVVDSEGMVSATDVTEGCVVVTVEVAGGGGAEVSIGPLSPEHAANATRPATSIAERR
jgi:hypothetical protein